MSMLSKEEFLSRYARHLNEKQLRAVQTVDGPVLLLAVPGSGKTTVLVNRLGYMLYCAGIDPRHILTLTYTKAATEDMRRRFEGIFGNDFGDAVEFRTINGICAKIIAAYGRMVGKTPFSLVTDEKWLGKLVTDILAAHLSEYPTESDVKNARTLMTYCKNRLLNNEEIEALGEEADLPLLPIFTQYNAVLKEHQLMDYDDQMVYAYNLLRVSPELLRFYQDKYRYICVDEAQDTSKIQHLIIGLLAGKNGNLFMVGDEDQSIYGFRAAYPEALLHFENEHPKAQVLVMDQNYRSNAKIVAAADHFIQKNEDRHEKHMVAVRPENAEVRFIDLKKRANQYGYLLKVATNCQRETAVLYRDNESVIPLVDQLERQGIPFRIKQADLGFFTHRVVTDITNIMRFALDPRDPELFMRIYYKCQTYLKKAEAEMICRISGEKGIPISEAIDRCYALGAGTLKQCRSFQMHIKNMPSETPARALFRIECLMGYGEYLKRNGLDADKLFILKMLAQQEETIPGFLDRLGKLQDIINNHSNDNTCPFILSTVHSSKGLEYDRVYVMDVCDGVFPGQVVTTAGPSAGRKGAQGGKSGAASSVAGRKGAQGGKLGAASSLAGRKGTAAGRSGPGCSEEERKAFEEERRLFYVAMTRAKNDLNIFCLGDKESCFVDELQGKPVRRVDKSLSLNEKGSFGNGGTAYGHYDDRPGGKGVSKSWKLSYQVSGKKPSKSIRRFKNEKK